MCDKIKTKSNFKNKIKNKGFVNIISFDFCNFAKTNFIEHHIDKNEV